MGKKVEGQEPEPNNNEEDPSQDPQGAAAPADGQGGDEPSGEGPSKELEAIRKSLKEANDEAAARRVELRELKEKLRGKSPEDIAAELEEFDSRMEAKDQALYRERAARRFNLPDEMIERLRGKTEDEILADAEALSQLIAPKAPTPPSPPNPSGGRTPQTRDDESPEDLWKKARSVSDYN